MLNSAVQRQIDDFNSRKGTEGFNYTQERINLLNSMREAGAEWGWNPMMTEPYYAGKIDPQSSYITRAGVYKAPTHGAVPESVEDSYLQQMLEYYKNAGPFQHALIPQEWEEGTRYVSAPMDHPGGDVGPDYITMMNIMKAQEDPYFGIGFMGEDYMKASPSSGGYFDPISQTVALNPYNTLDFADPSVDAAFSLGAGKPRTLEDLEEGEKKLKFLEDREINHISDKFINEDRYTERGGLAHELDHAFTKFKSNTPEYVNQFVGKNISPNKFTYPYNTSDVNLTGGKGGRGRVNDLQGIEGHNEAYWIGRGHHYSGKGRGMHLNQDAASNYAAKVDAAKSYIDSNRPRGTARFNTGGIAGLPGQWTPSMSESEEEEYNIRPLQLDPGIMSIEDLEDLFEEAGLDKRLIYNLINTGGLSQFVV